MRLSVCMIVRDEEECLPRALQSVAGLADEIVVCDTGSVDCTPEIARAAGARVIDFAWCEHFARACNAAFDAASMPASVLACSSVIPAALRAFSSMNKRLDSRAARVASMASWLRSSAVGNAASPGSPARGRGRRCGEHTRAPCGVPRSRVGRGASLARTGTLAA